MASAVIGALRVTLGLDSAAFETGLKDARKSLARAGRSMQSVGKTMTAAVSVPVVAFGALTLKAAGDFEAGMNRVGAATAANAEQLAAMRDLARELGRETQYSATESADAMETLAKNGLNVEQILGGATDAALKLAAASGTDMAGAADVATDVMLDFGKKAGELTPVINGITGVLLQSKFGFDDYRLALGQAGGVAGSLGVSLDDFNTVVAATSSAFASGSDAGTSFKQFLVSLTPKSKQAAAAMEELGLSFFNADGSMKSMSAVAGELQTKMAGLSEEDLNEKMKTIFGTDAMRTAIMLMKQGSEGFDQMQAKIAEGNAAEQAAARMQGFNGAMKKLASAFESLQIAIAESGLIQWATDITTALATFIAKMSESNPTILKWGTIIAGLAVTIGPVLVSLGLLVTAVGAISAPVIAAVAAVAALTAGVVAFWPEIVHAKDVVVEFAGKVAQVFVEMKDKALAAVRDLVNGVSEWFGAKLDAAIDKVKNVGHRIAAPFKDAWDAVVGHSWVPDLVMGVETWLGRLSTSAPALADQAGQGVKSAFSDVGGIGDDISQSLSGAFQSLIDGSKNMKDVVKDVLADISKSLLNSGLNALFGQNGFGMLGGGGFFGGIVKGIGSLFGFAQGGSFQVGGAGGIDSQLVAFRASPNETVSITKPGQDMGGSGIAGIRVFVDQDGNWQAKVESIADDRASAITRGGISEYDKTLNRTFGIRMTNAQGRQL